MTNRELDAEIATKVTGLDLSPVTVFYAKPPWLPHGVLERIGIEPWTEIPEAPRYSSDLNEALRVIEKMREKGLYIGLFFYPSGSSVQMQEAKDADECWDVQDESPARAICLCALKVIEETGKLSPDSK